MESLLNPLITHYNKSILRTFVAETPFLSLNGSTTNLLEALCMLQNQPVNLVFLDNHMP